MLDCYFRSGDSVYAVSLEPDGDTPGRAWRVHVGERVLKVTLRRRHHGRLELFVDGRPVRAWVAHHKRDRFVQIEGAAAAHLERVDSSSNRRAADHEGMDALIADTPAQVVSVAVEVGDPVTHGDTLLVLEAMKMEFRLVAPHDGQVTAIHCQPGEVVERGKLLLEVARTDN